MNSFRAFSVLALVCALSLAKGAWADDLPDAAKKLLAELDQEVTAVQKKADEEIKVRTEKYLESLQAMQDTYTKASQLDEAVAIRDRIRALKANLVAAQPDPGTLMGFNAQPGQRLHFEVIGATTGPVWGSGLYTDDSNLASAAVHAGVLQNGQQGIVAVTILPGMGAYEGSTLNGVTSAAWGTFPRSYRVEAVGRDKGRNVAAAAAQPAPESMLHFRGQVGKGFLFEVTGRTTGPIWGTGTYTDDSDLGTAAVHSGLVRPGEKKLILVTMVPGQAAYKGSTLNGATSMDYRNWESSYRLEAARRQ